MGMTKMSKEDADKINIERYERDVVREPKACIVLNLKDSCHGLGWDVDSHEYGDFADAYSTYILEDTIDNIKLISDMEKAINEYKSESNDFDIWEVAIEPYLDKMTKFNERTFEIEW